MKNLFADVRTIVAASVVCMLLLIAFGCDNTSDLEGAEIFTSEFHILKGIGTNCDWIFAPHCHLCDGPCFSFAGAPPWRGVPINLPREFQRSGLFVNVTFRKLAHQRCSLDAIEIIRIEEIK